MKKILALSTGLFLYALNVNIPAPTVFPNEFADFDEEFQQSVDTNKTFSINGKFKLRYYHFYRNTEIDNFKDRKNFIDALLEVKNSYHKDIYSFNSTLFFMRGNFSDTYKTRGVFLEEFRDMQRKVPIIGIKEAYFLQNKDNYDFIIGKRIYVNSSSMIYSPSDIFNLNISPDPLELYKVGSWQVRCDYFKDNATYTFVFFPFYEHSKTVSDKTRWGGNNNVNTSTNNTQGNNSNINSSTFNTNVNTNLFVLLPSYIATSIAPVLNSIQAKSLISENRNKLRAVFGYRNSVNGYDITSNMGIGVSPYPIIKYTSTPGVYQISYPPTAFLSYGVSTTVNKLELHSEAYYQNVYDNQDDDYISLVIGGKYTFTNGVEKLKLQQLDMILEYAKEIFIDGEHNYKVLTSSRNYRLFKNDVLLKLTGKINEKWNVNYFTNFRLFYHSGDKTGGSYQKLGTTYKPKDGMKLSLYLELFNGQENNIYGQWKRNDRVISQITYNF
jgi:hypothetical protein